MALVKGEPKGSIASTSLICSNGIVGFFTQADAPMRPKSQPHPHGIFTMLSKTWLNHFEFRMTECTVFLLGSSQWDFAYVLNVFFGIVDHDNTLRSGGALLTLSG